MDSHILIALTGAFINMVLSTTVPCLVKKTDQPFLKDVKKVFEVNRQVIITSSIIVAFTIYLALKIAPELHLSDNDTGLNFDYYNNNNNYNDYDYDNRPLLISGNMDRPIPLQLSNLIKLMQK